MDGRLHKIPSITLQLIFNLAITSINTFLGHIKYYALHRSSGYHGYNLSLLEAKGGGGGSWKMCVHST